MYLETKQKTCWTSCVTGRLFSPYNRNLFSCYIIFFSVSFFFLTSSANAVVGILGNRLLDQWQYAEAEELAKKTGSIQLSDGDKVFLGRLAFISGDYKKAAEYFSKIEGGAPYWLELAQNSLKVVQDFESIESENFLIRHPGGKHQVMVDAIIETLEKTIKEIALPWKVKPEKKIIVEILPDIERLSMMTPLTLNEIRTSGTIALCKYNKLMVVSPISLYRGYRWQDTLSHELIHWIISVKSKNTVPIWLHEGMAKMLETRWNNGKKKKLAAYSNNLLGLAVKNKKMIPFAKMHPSMAKLPSQDDTALAFAEVFDFLVYLENLVGFNKLGDLLQLMGDGKSLETAIKTIFGKSLSRLEKAWKKDLEKRDFKIVKGLIKEEKKFKGFDKSENESTEKLKAEEKAEGETRKMIRLAELLYEKSHKKAALIEYEKAMGMIKEKAAFLEVFLRSSRLYFENGRYQESINTIWPFYEIYPGQMSINLALARSYLKLGDYKKTDSFLKDSLSINPFDPETYILMIESYKKQGKTDLVKSTAEKIRLLEN